MDPAQVMSEFGTEVLIIGVVALLLVVFVISRIRARARRARAFKMVSEKYGLSSNRLQASLGIALPRLEGEVSGATVSVTYFNNRSFDSTVFSVGVRAPTFGMAVIEPRSDVGSKGLIGAFVESRHVGDNAIPMSDPGISKTFRVRGEDGAGLQRALANPSVVQQLMSLQRTVESVSIEWGLLKFYTLENIDDPDELSALLDRGVALAQWLEHAAGHPAQPTG